jgi:hypothetical protein
VMIGEASDSGEEIGLHTSHITMTFRPSLAGP